MKEYEEKCIALRTSIEQLAAKDMVVAFSGGADSSLLLKLACEAAGRNGRKVYAVTVHTRLHPAGDLEAAERTARETGAIHRILFADELEEAGIRPDAVAGFSLGEMAAATVAGAFDLDTGFRLVCHRGRLMAQAADKVQTAMAAVVKLSGAEVEALCENFDGVYAVNYNCPGQTTVSGLSAQMPAFCAAVKAAGGRAIPLKVSGGFHAPFMQEAAEGFAQILAEAPVHTPALCLYSNVTGLPYDRPAAALLAQQIASPVRWEDTLRHLAGNGADTFIEIGPGRTLTGLVKKTLPQAQALTWAEYQQEVKGC